MGLPFWLRPSFFRWLGDWETVCTSSYYSVYWLVGYVTLEYIALRC